MTEAIASDANLRALVEPPDRGPRTAAASATSSIAASAGRMSPRGFATTSGDPVDPNVATLPPPVIDLDVHAGHQNGRNPHGPRADLLSVTQLLAILAE